MAFKYIIFEKPDLLPTVRLFDGITSHNEVAQEVGLKVVSAGFLYSSMTAVSGSVSMCIPHDGDRDREDTQIIRRIYELV